MKIFLLIIVVCSVNAQNSFELQFIGDSLSQEEATDRELCNTKYCLLDAKYLFSAATQNKSVRPCDDFKEFALGTFEKYESVSDRNTFSGFFYDLHSDYFQKGRRVLAAPVNVNDSRISKGIKTFFAKCVNSRNIRKNGVSEAREHLRSFGLKFYPETNEKDFNLKNYIEQERTNSLKLLFLREVDYSDDSNQTNLQLKYFNKKIFELQLESYETMLYEMNQIFRNSSFSEEFTKEFKEIANRQIEFYQQLKNLNSTVEEENSSELMTIDELNNLTSPLNLNWLTIINNQLFTKINSSARIFVPSPQSFSKIAKFLAENDIDAIADYLVYDLLYELIEGFLVYAEDKYQMASFETSRSSERWQTCYYLIAIRMAPALDALYLQRYFDKKSEDALRKFANETVEYALKRFKSINRFKKRVLKDVNKKLQSVKFVFGYSEEFIGAEMLEELYGNLDFDQNLINVLHQMYVLHEKHKREPKIRELLELGKNDVKFRYRLSDNIIFLKSRFLSYPFYHDQRPRFFNTATVVTMMFRDVLNVLREYLNNKYDLNIPKFRDQYQYAYEFYKDWLESGGEELNLGANRLTNRQLYWIALARIRFSKYHAVKLGDPIEIKRLNDYHNYIYKNPGFKEAFDCEINN